MLIRNSLSFVLSYSLQLSRLCSFCNPAEAVFARCLSALKDERVQASKHLKGPATLRYTGDKKECIENIRQVCTDQYI